MKQFICFLLSVVLTFNICCVSAFADTESNPATPSDVSQVLTDLCNDMDLSWDAFSRECWDAISDLSQEARPIICTYDTTVGIIGAGLKYFRQLVRSGSSPEQAIQTMGNCITVNGDGNTIIVGDGESFCNDFYNDGSLNGTGGSLSNLGYCEFYIASANYLNPVSFPNSSLFNACKNLIKNNPDYYFTISNYYGGVWRVFACSQAPAGGVLARQYWGDDKPAVQLYTDNWNQNFNMDVDGNKALITISTTYNPYQPDATLQYWYTNSDGEQVSMSESQVLKLDVDSILVPDSTVSQVNDAGWYTVNYCYLYGSAGALLYDYVSDGQQVGVNMQGRCPTLFHGTGALTAIPVFSTLNELKKGTLGKTTAQVLPSYTGNGINGDITDSQITQARDIISNYYQGGTPQGGNDNNNNNNNDNPSGSGWLDTLLNGLGSVGQALVKILGELLSIIGDAITAIVDAISGVLDILNTGFIDMLSAVFPFLPQEFWTVVLLALSLGLLGLIIKFFRG